MGNSRSRSWPGLAIAAFAVTCTLCLPASADKVLIYQTKNSDLQNGDTAGAEAELVFKALNHDVTLITGFTPTFPADLTPYDTVWIIQLPAYTSEMQNALIPYVNAGGGVYLTGERSCCEPLNSSVQNVLANLLRPPVPTVGATLIEGGDLFTPGGTDPFSITSKPNVLTEWKTKAAGLLSKNVNPDRVVFQNSAGKIGAAAYPPEDLQHGSGCVYVAMDLTFWQPEVAPEQDLTKYVANIQGFLKTCGDTDGDGLSDVAEKGYGTDPKDPDTDNDGLCDGYGAVTGVCVSGEHPLDDVDGDGLIAPLDTDDDDDGIPTAFEVKAEALAPNVDGDLSPAWNDKDSDNDNFYDDVEGTGDYDQDGIPAIVDKDDFPKACSEDIDCGSAKSGVVCDLDVGGYCKPGCRGANGNGCPDGETCSSKDASIGSCGGGADAGPDGGGSGGTSAGGTSAGGTSAGGTGPDGGGSGGASAGGTSAADGGAGKGDTSGDSSSCGCRSVGENADARWLAALAVLGGFFALRRRGAKSPS